MANRKHIDVPTLAHDAKMAREFQHTVSATGRVERRIVAALVAHMKERGWSVDSVNDGETVEPVSDAKAAMELIFNLDESRLTFAKGNSRHSVLLIGGNGIDIISDWGYFANDRDGFNAAMDAFDADEYA